MHADVGWNEQMCLGISSDMDPVQTLLMEDMPPKELHQLLHANDLLNASLQRWQALLALGVDDLADPSGDVPAPSDTAAYLIVACHQQLRPYKQLLLTLWSSMHTATRLHEPKAVHAES